MNDKSKGLRLNGFRKLEVIGFRNALVYLICIRGMVLTVFIQHITFLQLLQGYGWRHIPVFRCSFLSCLFCSCQQLILCFCKLFKKTLGSVFVSVSYFVYMDFIIFFTCKIITYPELAQPGSLQGVVLRYHYDVCSVAPEKEYHNGMS